MDRWTFYKDAAEEWRWKRVAPNNEVVGASSEGYINRVDCLVNAERNGMPIETEGESDGGEEKG